MTCEGVKRARQFLEDACGKTERGEMVVLGAFQLFC
jgi:hypothetical protein